MLQNRCALHEAPSCDQFFVEYCRLKRICKCIEATISHLGSLTRDDMISYPYDSCCHIRIFSFTNVSNLSKSIKSNRLIQLSVMNMLIFSYTTTVLFARACWIQNDRNDSTCKAWRINRNQRIQSISELRKLARKKNLDHSKINFVSIFIKTKYYVHESRCVQFINSFTLR